MANKSGGRKYSAGQKKAYYSGMGYRAAFEGKKIPFRNESNKDSFRQGYRDAGKKVSKYPPLGSKRSSRVGNSDNG